MVGVEGGGAGLTVEELRRSMLRRLVAALDVNWTTLERWDNVGVVMGATASDHEGDGRRVARTVSDEATSAVGGRHDGEEPRRIFQQC